MVPGPVCDVARRTSTAKALPRSSISATLAKALTSGSPHRKKPSPVTAVMRSAV